MGALHDWGRCDSQPLVHPRHRRLELAPGRHGTTIGIPVAALLALQAGRPEDAGMLLGASDHLGELYGVKAPLGLRELLGVSDPRGHVVEALGEEGYEAAFATGRQMTLEQVVALIVRIQDETWGAGQATAERSA